MRWGLSLATCVLVSILPAWSAGRLDLVTTLKRQSSGSLGGPQDRWQAILVGGQLTIVMVMLAGAGLLTRSFVRLVNVNPGFETAGLVVFTFQFSDPRYTQAGVSLEFIRRLDELVESSNLGASSAYSVGAPPRGGGFRSSNEAEAEGRQVTNSPDLILPTETAAPDYFQTLGIPLIAGRTFAADEVDGIVINDVLARRYWGDESPIGQRFRLGREQPWRTVIGVVGDVKQMGLSDPMGEGMEVYFPFLRDSRAGFLTLTVRTTGEAASAIALVKDLVRRLDPTLPLTAETMDQRFAESVSQPRFFLRLVVAFAVAAVLLAGVGVYATAAYWVLGRRRELAVRMAIGATRAQVINMILRRGLSIALVGAMVGLAASIAGARVIESMLFATSARDPFTLMAATLSLAVMVLIGCCVPALRAARTDPMAVLRAE